MPAQGAGRMFEGVASGTVTRGDLLKGTPDALVRNTDKSPIVGVATSGSADAINGKITYVIPGADEAFWADVADASTLAAGDLVSFDASFVAAADAVTPQAIVLKGVDDVTQVDGGTRVLVQIQRADQVFV